VSSKIAKVSPVVMGGKSYQQKIKNLFGSSLIGYWPLNELTGSIAYDISGKTSNILTNGDFETAGAGGADVFGTWVETAGTGAIASEATIFHGGAAAAKLTAGATTNTKIANTITVVPGVTYVLSFWTRGDETYGGRYGVFNVTGGEDIIAATATGVTGITYTQVNVSFTAPASCVSIRIDLWCPSTNTGIVYFDDVQLIGPRHGLYSGVDLANTSGPTQTKQLAPLFDGTNTDIVNILTSSLIAGFNGDLGSWFMWLKVQSAGVWTDGVRRDPGFIGTTGSNSFLNVRKTTGNNLLSFYRDDTGTAQNVDITMSLTTWFCLGATWSQAANQFIVYLNGAQTGTTKTCAAWDAGALAVANIGSSGGSVNKFSGWECQHILANRVATPAEAASIYLLGV
jgi:hypothetical protein